MISHSYIPYYLKIKPRNLVPRKKVHSPTDANANGENVNMSVPSSTLCMGSASLDPATKINGYHEQNMKKYLNVSYIRKIKLRAMLRKVVRCKFARDDSDIWPCLYLESRRISNAISSRICPTKYVRPDNR